MQSIQYLQYPRLTPRCSCDEKDSTAQRSWCSANGTLTFGLRENSPGVFLKLNYLELSFGIDEGLRMCVREAMSWYESSLEACLDQIRASAKPASSIAGVGVQTDQTQTEQHVGKDDIPTRRDMR
eukprot:s5120_g2.t1